METNLDSSSSGLDLVHSFSDVHTGIVEDGSGENTRKLVEYFDDCAEKSMEMRLRSSDFAEKELAGMINEAFEASKRIVIAVWEKTHKTALN
jgi:hypothetical protein